jgi:hypothetical protein
MEKTPLGLGLDDCRLDAGPFPIRGFADNHQHLFAFSADSVDLRAREMLV